MDLVTYVNGLIVHIRSRARANSLSAYGCLEVVSTPMARNLFALQRGKRLLRLLEKKQEVQEPSAPLAE